jgi:tetratricopeptide (TPR) repeat protein
MNLLLSRETGKVKIADFGLAIEQDASRMTTAGKVLGTLAYMSPEQILGKQKIDARTDIYALGVTLFELLTLAFPYAGETQQMYLNAVLSSEARPARKLNARVGRDLDIVIRKAIEKRPEDRYAAADELADDLENVLHFRPIHAVPPSPAARAIKWVRRKPLHAALAALLAVGLPVIALLGQRASERQTLMREREIAQGVDDVRWLRQRARHAELIERASRILELDPDHELALQLRAVSHLALAVDGEDAGGHAAAALSDIDRLAGLLPGEVWPLRLEGYALDKLGRVDEAAAVHAAVEAARPETRKETYNDLFFDGLLAQERGDHEAALAFFERARALSPSSTEPIQLHAASLEALGRPAEAIQDYRLIVGLNPDDGYGNLDLGRLLTETGAAEEGEAYMRRASRRLPENALVHQALAHNTLARGHAATGAGDLETAATLFARAEAHARDSLRFGPDDPWSHLDLGAALTDQERIAGTNSPQRVEEAIEHYRSALDLLRQREGGEAAEQYAAALVNICDAVILMGRLEQALVDCRNAVQRLPDDAMGFYNLAGVYALLGRPEEALEALERDFELGDRDWAYLESDAWFESLRRDPRFRDLVDRMKYRTDATSETRTN